VGFQRPAELSQNLLEQLKVLERALKRGLSRALA
jgi:hypothetical protein